MAQSRQDAEKRGRRAELLAEWFLRLKGYQILEKRAKTPVGEIDLIARKGKIIAIVEVKQRQNLDSGLNAVSQQAWQRISRAAESRLGLKYQAFYNADRRFDLIVVLPGLRICHEKDIWRPDFALTRD